MNLRENMLIDKNKIFLQIGNFSFAFLTVIINILANALPINNKNTGELSDNIPNLFVPSGITFAIWGVIYVLIIAFAIYQIRDIFKDKKIDMPFIKKISFWFILASLGNIIWIFFWHYELVVLSILPMLLLFISLLVIYQKLEIGIKKTSKWEKIFVHIPISVYFGWITVATVANITGALVKVNWNGFGISEMIWTILIIAVVSLITVIVLYKRNDIAYSLVIIWALLGIFIKRINFDKDYGIQTEIAWTSVVAILVIFITILFVKFFKKKK